MILRRSQIGTSGYFDSDFGCDDLGSVADSIAGTGIRFKKKTKTMYYLDRMKMKDLIFEIWDWRFEFRGKYR